MAAGLVILQGTTVAADAGGFGFVPASAFDRSVSTLAHLGTAAGAYIGLDLGAGKSATPSKFRLAPRPSTNDGAAYEISAWGGAWAGASSLVQGSNVSATSTLTTLATIDNTYGVFRRAHLREISLSGSTAFRWMRFANEQYAACNEMQFLADPTTFTGAVACRPLEPTITPGGGRYSAGESVSVTMACRTTTATIFYTTDGTTPAHTAGVPSGTTLTYTAPLTITPSVAGVTIKALAYDASCTTTDSDVATSAPFIIQGFTAKQTLYQVGDLTGWSPAVRTIECHAGQITPPSESGDGYYHWFGHFSDCTNNGGFDPGFVSIWHYRSTDCRNWTLVDIAVDMTYLDIRPDETDSGVRPNVIKRADGTGWVMWIKAKDSDYVPDDNAKAYIFTATTLNGPWTLATRDTVPITSPRTYDSLSDFSFFKDTDGSCYVVASVYLSATPYVAIQKLSDDRLTCTGTGVEIGQASREATVLVKSGSNYFLIHSKANYYDSVSDVFDLKYTVGTGGTTPLNTSWGSLSGTELFSTSILANADLNGQSANVVDYPGVGKVLLMDWWTQTENFASYYTHCLLTFPTATTMRADAGVWSPPSTSGGHRTPPGHRARIEQHNARVRAGR